MRQWFRRVAALLLLALILLSPICPAVGASGSAGDAALPAEMVRVGLFYGIGAKAEVQLETSADGGFRMGFYDDSRVLHAVARTPERTVIVTPNRTAELSFGGVGAYHLRLPAVYDSFDEASDAARRNDGFPAFCNGVFYVMLGSYAAEDEAQQALAALGREAEVYGDSGRGVLVLAPGSDTPLFLFDYASTHALTLSPSDSTEEPTTLCGSYRYRGDFQFNRVTGDGLTVSNCVGLEDYVKGVVPNEMASDWPLEALKAQAVCARTYVLKNLNAYRIYGFDVTDDTASQVYRGLHEADATTDRACEETAGEVLRYDGGLCAVYYFAADGGATESAETVWNDVSIPYLRSVADPYESQIDFYCKSWTCSVAREPFGEISATYGESGNVLTLTVGDRTYRNDGVRDFLVSVGAPYNSRRFTVDYDADADVYVIHGSGFGHNLGMSQWGANAMARNHGMTYDEILSFYFIGATIA